MAFSSAVKSSAYLGPGIKMTVGTWSGAYGDAAGTIVVSGAHIWGALFFSVDANGNTDQIFPKLGISVSGSTTTITVNNQDAVTLGRFIIFHQA